MMGWASLRHEWMYQTPSWMFTTACMATALGTSETELAFDARYTPLFHSDGGRCSTPTYARPIVSDS